MENKSPEKIIMEEDTNIKIQKDKLQMKEKCKDCEFFTSKGFCLDHAGEKECWASYKEEKEEDEI